MSKIQYRHIDFDGASLIQRRHKRQVVPPGMWAIDNMFLSRSDNNPTLRPDFKQYDDAVYAVSDTCILQESAGVPDIVNSVTSLYGSDRLVYLTTYVPWTSISGVPAIASGSYTTGTATASDNSMSVLLESLGTGIDLHHKAWRGCLLEIKGDGNYYVVDKVTSSTPGSDEGTLNLVAPTEAAYSGDTYELWKNHNCYRAAFNKMEIAQNGASLFYATPDIATQIGVEDITGPFYGDASESDWEYGGKTYFDTIPTNELAETYGKQYTLATNGVKWVKVLYTAGISAATIGDMYYLTSDVSKNDTWDDIGMGDQNLQFYSIIRNPTRGFLCGGNTQDHGVSPDFAACVIYGGTPGSDDSTWTYKTIEDPDDSDAIFDGETWRCQSAWDDGTTMTVVIWKSSDNSIRLLYSTDDGDTWANTTGVNTFTGTEQTKIKYVKDNFVVCSGAGYIYYSTDGQAFTALNVAGDVATMTKICDTDYNNADGGSDVFCLVSSSGHIATCATVSGTYASTTPSKPANYGTPAYNFVLYDDRGSKFIIPLKDYLVTSEDYGATWNWTSLSRYGIGATQPPTNLDWSGQDLVAFYDTVSAEDSLPVKWIVFNRSYIVSWDVADFAPVSEIYRANSVSVLDGYTVLVGTREYETDTWVYYPRTIRWSVAGSPVDFANTGSGSGKLRGSGALLRSEAVNGRIVIFETVAVGALVPRGDTDDPWDYDIIDENFSFLSNPVAVDDVLYIVGSDGLLYTTDGIGAMQEVGASFDLTELDDFDETKPVWLTYSEEFNSLFCYYRDDSLTIHPAYMVSVATGGISELRLLHLDDSDDLLVEVPGSIIGIENAPIRETMVSYGPTSDDTNNIVLARLNSGQPILGKDVMTSRATTDQDGYWNGLLETGELYVTAEGEKSSIKHLIVETYTDDSIGDNSDRPYLVAEVKSIEDSDYATSGDAVGTATMTTTALTGSGTVWSTTVAGPSAGTTQQECDGATKTFTLPCLGSQARVYLDTTLQTAYTSSAKTITFTTAPGATKTLYVYWENYPEAKVKVGDMFKSTEGFHRVTAISSAQDITLDHYLSTGSQTVTHYPAWQLDDGHGRIEIGINRLVEEIQLRLYLIPAYDGTQQSTVAKITGLSIGYVPVGRKIVKATGS